MSEAKDSTALLLCAFILINSQITLGVRLLFLTFLSEDVPQGVGHIALEKMGVFRLACLPNTLRVLLSDQRGAWPIRS